MPIEYIHGSITDVPTVEKALQGVDVVFHVAALVDWGQAPYDKLYQVS